MVTKGYFCLLIFLHNVPGEALKMRFGLVEDPVGLYVTIRRVSTVTRTSLLSCFDACVRWQKWPPCQGVLLKEEELCDLVSVTDRHGQPIVKGQGDLYVRDCPEGYIAHGGWECYKLVDTRPATMSWWQSWELCKQDGAFMVTIETPEEHQRIASMLQVYTIPGVPNLVHSSGNDILETNKRRWGIEELSHDADYMPFNPNQPAHIGIEHCYTMYRYTGWLMHDYPCNAAFNFYICEI